MKCLRITGTMHVFEDFQCDRSSDLNLSFGCNPESSDFCNNKKRPGNLLQKKSYQNSQVQTTSPIEYTCKSNAQPNKHQL